MPSSTGGAVASYAVAPALPVGLSIDSSTGVIGGTPSAITATATYVVTATNSGGSTTAMLSITVNDLAPSNLAYATNPAVYPRGVAIAPNTPSSSGGAVVTYAVSPALPAGLAMSTSTGVISGTPTTITPAANYTITATNTGGSTTAMVSIRVNEVPPSNLVYSTNPASYTKGTAIANNTPSSSGGPVGSYAIAPALPMGLSISPSTGVISGTPTAVTSTATYVVTATNAAGSTTANVSITVNDIPPTNLTYSTNPAIYHRNTKIASNTPSSSGGAVSMYTVSPSLPAGLSMNSSTGVITGIPFTVTPAATCTVTASNGSGSTSVGLSIRVDELTIGQISTGTAHTCAVVNGGAQCWGYNTQGQLGNNTFTNSAGPVSVVGLGSGVTSIGAGDSHSCAVVNGGVKCWGYNFYGQLGNGTTTSSLVPVQVSGLTSGVTAVAVGWNHSCAIVNGGVQCWGFNTDGELGNNATAHSSPPVSSSIAGPVTSLVAGWYNTCALVGGSAKCWGFNNYGQVGTGATSAAILVPTQVTGLTMNVTSIDVGYEHTCAVHGGAAKCWGRNTYGQLGNNTTMYSASPVQVIGLASGVTSVGLEDNTSCALISGGVQCWGLNDRGQIGNGTTTNSLVPASVVGFADLVDLQSHSGVGMHACARVDTDIQCWGYNGSGQLGDGSTANATMPTFVGTFGP
jgi:alpha-tubulin suppressor-like RCC1 family protein